MSPCSTPIASRRRAEISSTGRAGDADLLAGRQIRLHLLLVQSRDGRRHRCRPSNRRPRESRKSPFCPNIAATPDGQQVWFTLKDTGKVEIFDAKPPFNLLKTLDTGPITNHVNFAHNANGTFAYVSSIGGLNEVKVFRTDDFSQDRNHPHGQSSSRRVAVQETVAVSTVRLENADALAAIDTIVCQQGCRQWPFRSGPGAAGDHLCSERGAGRRRNAESSAARDRGTGRALDDGIHGREQGRAGTNERHLVRPGSCSGRAGFRHRT